MTQPVLPFFSPRERGRLNAIRNLLASVDDELRRRAGVAQEIVVFVTRELPNLFREFSPLMLESASHQNPFLLSQRPFELKDFSFNPNRPEVFSSTTELLQNIDVERLAAGLQGVELTGIDESKVDAPLPHSSMAFLRSIAFRMYRTPNGEQDEAVGPLLSELRLRLRDSEGFELENQLMGYLRNTYIAYSTQPAYRKAIDLAFSGQERVQLLPRRGRMGRPAFYKVENLENLVEVLRSHLRRKKGIGRQV